MSYRDEYENSQREYHDLKLCQKRIDEAIEYCSKHLDFMWAASIVGILLGCDFRDAQKHVYEWRKKNEQFSSNNQTT